METCGSFLGSYVNLHKKYNLAQGINLSLGSHA